MEIDTVTKCYSVINNEFVSYNVTYKNSDIESSVPLSESNLDYQAIQQWIADGGTVIDNGE